MWLTLLCTVISLTRGGHEERTTLLHEFDFFCKTLIEAGAPMGPPRPHPLKNEAPSQEMTHTKKKYKSCELPLKVGK